VSQIAEALSIGRASVYRALGAAKFISHLDWRGLEQCALCPGCDQTSHAEVGSRNASGIDL